MWLNEKYVNVCAINKYRKVLRSACPNYVVIDGLFDETKLDEVIAVLREPHNWQAQKHTYCALYVDGAKWQSTSKDQRFVQRDVWCRDAVSANRANNIAQEFLSFLRGDAFMSLLSRIFNVQLTDINVAEPNVNTNYFRLATTDFVAQHADDSPGREVCMLLYLNKNWSHKAGGELRFLGKQLDREIGKKINEDAIEATKARDKQEGKSIAILPLYNRCVLFNPSSVGSEHWVKKSHSKYADSYRYNVTSWYWVE